MVLKGLLSPLMESIEFNNIIDGFDKGFKNQLIYGLSGSAGSFFIGGLAAAESKVLIITANLQQAYKKIADLKTLLPDREVVLYPESESVYYDVLAQSKEVVAQRLTALEKLLYNNSVVVVAPVEAILKKITPVNAFKESYISLKVGDQIAIDELVIRLTELGYERVDMVEGPGHISLRGGILDVFPLTEESPYRIEFFDIEVDSIRRFDKENQRSTDNCREVRIPPARELVINREDFPAVIGFLKKELALQEKRLVKTENQNAVQKLRQRVGYFIEQLAEGIYFETIDQLLPFFYQESTLVTDYLAGSGLVIFDEPARLKEALETKAREIQESMVSFLEKGLLLPTQSKVYIEGIHKLAEGIKELKVVSVSLLPKEPAFFQPQNIISVSAKSIHGYLGKVETLSAELKNWRKKNYSVVILVSTEERAQKIRDILADYKIESFYTTKINKEIRSGNVVITNGLLESGFEFHQFKVVFLTDQEIFGQKKKTARKVKDTGEGLKITNIEDLHLGDFIVHVNHGIGRYMGVNKLEIGGYRKDYFVIKYAGEDKLYVPTDQVNLIQKYLGTEGKSPKLNKLGGNEWARAKSRVKESLQNMARELLELYAARQAQAGYQYSPDTVWQRDFEDAFAYEETNDQIKAIQDIKRDMENRKPMDRLLCGDVGYGKTEVAIRAAFKAVMDGKQVAVLVPTTILAQQHYNTFTQRFAGFPVNIDVLSRFRTAKQQKQTLDKLKQGRIDIIIGTHRLIQNDVSFKDLGLMVVDEEQRFGVAHKERLKSLKKNIEVLTLTATPIPRTLHMAMIGARDISTLENPPEDRFPVQTYVMEFQPDILRDAVQREIDRSGQVFFVHNRISDILKVARELQTVVPEARIAVAHGQMREDELEKTLLEFISGEYDVLVCTTIIETGLDIPNVNTIIVNEADRFGLSQLYQLRGRVGRSHRIAYAYFTYKKEKVLSEIADKRLHAIREFTEFGSGFKIAMRDLEIRGAGNILGPEQHGQMLTVGFDLYCRLLENTIKELKGEVVREIPEASIEINIDAYIRDEYIPDQAQKIDLYKRIMAINDAKDAFDVQDELLDRYGEIPTPVSNLLVIARIKALATKLKIESIKQLNGSLLFKFWPEHALTGEILVELSRIYSRNIAFSSTERFEIKYNLNRENKAEIADIVEKFLETIHKLVKI